MNLAVLGAVFAIIFVGELPDKTMVASLVMSARGRPGAVWLGAAGAFMVHVVIATTLGTVVFHLLAPQAVDAVVAVIFLAGAGLAVGEAVRERRRREDPEPPTVPPPSRPGRTAVTAFAVIFAAEWGDLTQLLTAGGQWLGRVVDAVLIRVVTAVLLAGFGIYTAWAAVS